MSRIRLIGSLAREPALACMLHSDQSDGSGVKHMKGPMLVLGGLLTLGACDAGEPGDPEMPARSGETAAGTPGGAAAGQESEGMAGGGGRIAHVELEPTEGNAARGTVRFSDADGRVAVAGSIEGLPPGEHGLHIHERGDCSAPDASSAGDHFNPRGAPHGSPQDPLSERHLGDLGNVTAGADGVAQVDIQIAGLSLEGPESIIGKALVVHADADDFETQPSGDSGDRLGCGVIEGSVAAGDRP